MTYLRQALATIATMTATAITAAACSTPYSTAAQQPIGLPIEQPQPTPHFFRMTAPRVWSGTVKKYMSLAVRDRQTGRLGVRDAYLVEGENGDFAIANTMPDPSCPSGIDADAKKAMKKDLEISVEEYFSEMVPLKTENGVLIGLLKVVEVDGCIKFPLPVEPKQPPAAPLPARQIGGDYA